jgi:hypothetical protein
MKAEFATIENTVDLLTYITEEISLEFDQWDSRYARGPSLYFLVVSRVQVDSFVDQLGTNRWPVETARRLPGDFTPAVQAAEDVAFGCDGAIIVAADGTFQEQMVRVRSSAAETTAEIQYADWMSAKQMSALEASVRDGVLAAVTLSEETGRVTRFENGSYSDYQSEAVGGRWRVETPETVSVSAHDGGS